MNIPHYKHRGISKHIGNKSEGTPRSQNIEINSINITVLLESQYICCVKLEVQQTFTNFQIVIEGVVGPGWSSDIAIDELVVLNSACKIQPSNAVVDTPVLPPTTPPTVPSGGLQIILSVFYC